MDSKIAFEILEIDFKYYGDIDYDFLKKRYHKLALKNHPDKNGNTYESNDKFKKINEAFEYLKTEIKFVSEDDNEKSDPLYADFLQLFLSGIMNGSFTDVATKIIKEIVTSYKTTISKGIFEGLDRDTSLKVYSFLSKYHSTFNLSQEILNEVKDMVTQKFNELSVYNLNPNINDLLENNVYKLYVDDRLYIVPLWHHELYFEDEKNELLVLCQPILPDNITIDEDNNLHIEIKKSLNEMSLDNNITFNLGGKVFEIPIEKLFFRKKQTYRLKNNGVSRVKDDIYDINEKSDIIIKIQIV